MRTILLIIILFSSQDIYSQHNADSIAIVKLLQYDYVALANADIEAYLKYRTKDYLLIENGEIWDLEKEVEYMKSKIGLNTIRIDKFDFKKLYIENSFAYVVYELKSDITRNNETTKYHWTESAILNKIAGEWKIKLIH